MGVIQQLKRWYPRRAEYEKYIHWDKANPKKYTRNVIFSNEHMDVVLMCWPPRCASSLHCHDTSSCWVALCDGVVHESQFAIPAFDRKFIEAEMLHPTGAKGRCGPIRLQSVTQLGGENGTYVTYINNSMGIHVVENRSDQPAYTVHVYAPGLRRMKMFSTRGEVTVGTAVATEHTDAHGHSQLQWSAEDGQPICASFCLATWNRSQARPFSKEIAADEVEARAAKVARKA